MNIYQITYSQAEVDALIAAIGLDEVLTVDDTSPDNDINLTNGDITANVMTGTRLLIGGVTE